MLPGVPTSYCWFFYTVGDFPTDTGGRRTIVLPTVILNVNGVPAVVGPLHAVVGFTAFASVPA